MVKNVFARGARVEESRETVLLAMVNSGGCVLHVTQRSAGLLDAADIDDCSCGSRDGSLKVMRSGSWSGRVDTAGGRSVALYTTGWNIRLREL